MKKSILLVLPISVICLLGCKSKDSKMPTIRNQDFRNVVFVDKDGNKSAFITTHFNNSPVGYISLGKTLDNILKECKMPIETKYQGHNYILHNTLTDSNCTIDFDKQTITYDNFDKYYIREDNYVPYIDRLISGGKQYFKIDASKSKYIAPEQGTTRVVDMSHYNIPLYFDQSYGYVPIDIVETLITPYLDLTLSYNGTHVYLGNLNKTDAKTRKAYFEEGNIFNSEYMEYTYNLLALQLDFGFGLDKRTYRLNGQKVEYFKEGAYKIIEPYHDRLVSLEPGVSDKAYIEIFDKNFDDGLHTGYVDHNCLAYEDTPITMGDEAEKLLSDQKKLIDARNDKKLSPKDIVGKECTHSFEILSDENKDIAIITFDEFTVPKEDYKEKDITKDNYWNNTLYTVTYANNQLRNTDEGKKVKNLIIDLSLNTGGASIAEHFIASWLCNGVSTKMRNTKDKTYQESSFIADVNRDGEFNDKDYLPSNIENVYCMVSSSSFSCGNLLPFHLKELRNENNTKIMGDCSGGGSCLVWNFIPTGLGVNYQISSPYQFGTKDSKDYNNFTSNENGIKADEDFYKIDDPYGKNTSKFYDRDAIFNAIHSKQ